MEKEKKETKEKYSLERVNQGVHLIYWNEGGYKIVDGVFTDIHDVYRTDGQEYPVPPGKGAATYVTTRIYEVPIIPEGTPEMKWGYGTDCPGIRSGHKTSGAYVNVFNGSFFTYKNRLWQYKGQKTGEIFYGFGSTPEEVLDDLNGDPDIVKIGSLSSVLISVKTEKES